MKLFLQRHAKAQKSESGIHDFDRALATKGLCQLEQVKVYLGKKNLKITEVHVSSAARTKETYVEIKSALNEHNLILKNELYLADRSSLLKYLWNINHGNDMMIIGHNNGISDLAMYFLDEAILLPTAGLIILEFEFDSWKECSKATATCFDLYLPLSS